jgi:hypothetical protein
MRHLINGLLIFKEPSWVLKCKLNHATKAIWQWTSSSVCLLLVSINAKPFTRTVTREFKFHNFALLLSDMLNLYCHGRQEVINIYLAVYF